MQALQTFNFKELPVRTVEIENEPYFVGKDIAEILGYARSDNAIRNHADSEDKLTHQFSASGQNRNMIIINESGLYSLIFDASKQSKTKNQRNRSEIQTMGNIRCPTSYSQTRYIRNRQCN